jgi:hypothetical protein
LDVPARLSNLLSAYHSAHWEVVVAELKGASGVLKRGSVLSAVAADAGKLTLTSAGSEATAYGILLEEQVDTSALQRRLGDRFDCACQALRAPRSSWAWARTPWRLLTGCATSASSCTGLSRCDSR